MNVPIKMIKYCFGFCVLLSVVIFGCSDPSPEQTKKTIAEPAKIIKHDTVKEENLTSGQLELLNQIKMKSLEEGVLPCLKANKIQADCGDNDSGGFKVLFRVFVDSSGKVTKGEIVNEDICGLPSGKLERINQCFLAFNNALVFPQGLRNMTLEFWLKRYVKS